MLRLKAKNRGIDMEMRTASAAQRGGVENTSANGGEVGLTKKKSTPLSPPDCERAERGVRVSGLDRNALVQRRKKFLVPAIR
jgi:hypothetical protein